MITYRPDAHYWYVGGDARAWSSAAVDYVDADDVALLAWQAAGGQITPAATEADLRDTLRAAGHARRAPGYVPHAVEMWQARAALRDAGKLTAATNAINQIGGKVKDAWEYGNTVRRDAPVIAAMGAALGLSQADTDALFVAAENMSV